MKKSLPLALALFAFFACPMFAEEPEQVESESEELVLADATKKELIARKDGKKHPNPSKECGSCCAQD